jgi:F-type H+-transporting ATPase subunit b
MRTLAIIVITLSVCANALPSEANAVSSVEDRNGGTDRGIFSGSFADAIWTVVAFVVLLMVLGKLAWRPMLNALKAREEHIKQQLDTAENTRKQAETLLDDYKQQSLQIIEKATEHADQQEKALIEKTTQEVIAMKRKAQADIEYARLAASQQLWQQAGDMLLSVSGEVLGRAITHEDNQRLICEAIEKLLQEEKTGTQT